MLGSPPKDSNGALTKNVNGPRVGNFQSAERGDASVLVGGREKNDLSACVNEETKAEGDISDEEEAPLGGAGSGGP